MTLLTLLVTGALAALLAEGAGYVTEGELVEKKVECEDMEVKDHSWGTGHDTAEKNYNDCMEVLAPMVENYVKNEAHFAKKSNEEWLKEHATNVGFNKYSLQLKKETRRGQMTRNFEVIVINTDTSGKHIDPRIGYAKPMKDKEINERHSNLRDKLTLS